ncbi:MAG TPA: hypothetical protein VN821_09135 [Candidatus Udaeobacter sp.]|nr:hypothetical protein [Candidatus Udaeobacter sp.]
MKAQIVAAFGSAGMAVQRRPQAEALNPGAAELRRSRPAPANEPAAQDFALAMRRVEAECYDTL